MPGKMVRSSVRVTRGAGSGHTSRLSYKRAGKTRTLMPVWDSSGESRFDCFLSYSHTDRQRVIARALQHGLHRFAKPFWRMRAVRVFRDETNLSANPALFDSIIAALNSSNYFLLLASPVAAQSRWVAKELRHWLTLVGRKTSSLS